jgi:cell fate regulator YaaT (PSP1 superfamily)
VVRVVDVRIHGTGQRLSVACRAGLDDLRPGDRCVVETAKGLEIGTVARRPREAPFDGEHPKVLRRASDEDLHRAAECARRAKEAFRIARERIAAAGLPMKPVASAVSFDGAKATIFFTAENRVDFRELVRDLAKEIRARIELRQIGARDSAGLLEGVGPCGRTLCCSTWLREFKPISIKMAKDQGLALTPSRISGVCGRLLCCLSYEHQQYKELRRSLPSVGDRHDLADGRGGVVVSVNLLRRLVRVRLEDDSVEEIAVPE